MEQTTLQAKSQSARRRHSIQVLFRWGGVLLVLSQCDSIGKVSTNAATTTRS
jgi:hypothetical protein